MIAFFKNIRLYHSFFIFALGVGLAACVTNELPYHQPMASSDETAHHEFTYTLGPDDILDITVAGEPSITGEYTINERGFIDMPMIGRLNINGLTTEQADTMISGFYSEGYLQNPDITIQLKSYRPFYILGEVETPGEYAFAEGLTIMQAAALAGGFTYRANKQDIDVIQKTSGQDVKKKGWLSTEIKPGDTVYIHERLF